MVSGDNWTTADINRAKLRSNHHHQQTNNQFFYRPNQQCQSTEGIKFCTHLLLYGIHLWADLDCDRRMGGSRPNQTQRRRIAAISAANRQSGGDDGCYYEKFWNFIAWAEPDPKNSIFRDFRIPSTIMCTTYRKQFYLKPVVLVPMESRDSEDVPFADLESL